MSESAKRLCRLVALVALVAAAAGALFALWSFRPRPSSNETGRSIPAPSYSETKYLNAGPDARFIGSAACASCHPNNHKSYLLTAHSRALADVDPAAEPPDGAFDHAASGRSYRVYRKDGVLHHEEVLRTAMGREISRIDLPVRYLVGSGHFSRTYLVEVDGYLHESPITWYASRKAWGISPGYDAPRHAGFERPVAKGCVVCHSGRVEATGEAANRVVFHEKVVSCENCHGAGSLHRDYHTAKKHAPGAEDLTIVHPGRLTRTLSESICAACHQSGAAIVPIRGRKFGDFQPGRPLTDYRIHYRLNDDGPMTVVGHVEQLRQSACYQKSADLTCTTCHDPHAAAKPKDMVAFYRGKCQTCHAEKPCGLAEPERRKTSPVDDCTSCHMPRGDTDIPHIAFSNHRIGRPRGKPAPAAGRAPELVAADDESHLDPIERERNLGLAYILLGRNPAPPPVTAGYREKARSLLESAHASGMRDGETLLGLAEAYWRTDRERAIEFAQAAIDAPDALPVSRPRGLVILADCEMQSGNHRAALDPLEELVRVRRSQDDWHKLGQCYLALDEPRRALAPLEKALAIRPSRQRVRADLAETYRRLGLLPRADEQREILSWLVENGRD
jgi:hypothetical protein